MSDFMKGKIWTLHMENNEITEIIRKTGVPRSTIINYIDRHETRGNHENLPHLGPPQTTTAEEDEALVNLAMSNTRLKHYELRALANINLSTRSIRRRLKKSAIRKWKAANCAKLDERLAAARLEWALEYADKTVEEWRKYTWSDEVSVEKGRNPNAVWVFRRRGERDKYSPENVNGQLKGHGVSLMLWSCFTSNIKGPLVPVEGRMTADSYIKLLETHLIPYMNGLQNHGINDPVFQQDNAPIHKAHRTLNFLKEQVFSTMHWPASSPDMNPIEHLWAVLKKELYRRFPETSTLPGGPATVKRALEERLAVVWNDIGAEVMDNLVESMPRRVAALIEAQGWYTKY
jgi:transposase